MPTEHKRKGRSEPNNNEASPTPSTRGARTCQVEASLTGYGSPQPAAARPEQARIYFFTPTKKYPVFQDPKLSRHYVVILADKYKTADFKASNIEDEDNYLACMVVAYSCCS